MYLIVAACKLLLASCKLTGKLLCRRSKWHMTSCNSGVRSQRRGVLCCRRHCQPQQLSLRLVPTPASSSASATAYSLESLCACKLSCSTTLIGDLQVQVHEFSSQTLDFEALIMKAQGLIPTNTLTCAAAYIRLSFCLHTSMSVDLQVYSGDHVGCLRSYYSVVSKV